MVKISSLYGRTVSLIAIVFIGSFAVLVLAFLSISAHQTRDVVRELDRSIQVANGAIRDFVITRDPAHAKRAKMILTEADETLQHHFNEEEYGRFHTELHLYFHSVTNLIETYQDRGFYEGDGLEGKIRANMIALEEELSTFNERRLLSHLLEIRRNEKNYLLRRDSDYQDGVHAKIDAMTAEISFSKLSSEKRSSMIATLTRYQHDFDELVYLTQKADWITDEMNTVRTYLGQTLADVIADEDEQAELFLWIALGLILFSFVGGIAYAVYIARGIIKPLERMRTLVKQLVDGELRDDLEFDENGELGELANAFGELAEQVRMRIEAENHVKASRAKLQAYADELETTKSALEDRAQELSSIVSELQEAQNVAQHTIISKTLFLANMSHEIRTPLNGIIGMTSLLTSEELRPDQYEIVNVIRSSGESLLAIVNEILDHAKIEQGGVDLEEAKFDVTSCIEDALDMVFKLAADKALELSYLVSDDFPLYVVGDRARLRQILINLLANAVKFTKSGDVQVRAKLVARTQHEVELQLEVEDTGIGISEEAQEYLFDPFRQAEASTTRKFGGTGLGLSIASHLCELMGGKMWLESEVDKGSTFYFTLKLRRDPEHLTEDMISDFATDHRVLLLSQNVRFGSSVTTMIRQGGGEATAVENLKKAKVVIKNESSVDLILIDDGDHKESALEKASKLKELAPDCRIVLFRAIGQRTSDELAPDRISKPVKRSSIKALFCEATCEATEDASDAGTEEARDDAREKASDAGTEEARNETPIYEIGKTPRRAADRKAAQKLGVLIVEDNTTNQKVALKMLERLGYSADLAENGEDAVKMVAKNIYDIVFMDMMMPGMDGLEATREIRRNKDIALQPIIVAFTANATSNFRIKCLEAGMDYYTSKPVSSETFAKILERARLERKTRHGARLNSPTGPSVA